MRKYSFEDFLMDDDNETTIQNSDIGKKIWISVFNPLVPDIFKEKILEELNDFIAKNEYIPFDKTDTVGAVLEACISKEVEVNEKYRLLIFIWNERKKQAKDYIIDVPILPIEEYFPEFRECIMQELENMIFGEMEVK